MARSWWHFPTVYLSFSYLGENLWPVTWQSYRSLYI